MFERTQCAFRQRVHELGHLTTCSPNCRGGPPWPPSVGTRFENRRPRILRTRFQPRAATRAAPTVRCAAPDYLTALALGINLSPAPSRLVSPPKLRVVPIDFPRCASLLEDCLKGDPCHEARVYESLSGDHGHSLTSSVCNRPRSRKREYEKVAVATRKSCE